MTRRLIELFGLAMIGDGLLGAVQTRRHMRLWQTGPTPVRKTMEYFTRRPVATRLLSVAELGLGLWLAHRQRP